MSKDSDIPQITNIPQITKKVMEIFDRALFDASGGDPVVEARLRALVDEHCFNSLRLLSTNLDGLDSENLGNN